MCLAAFATGLSGRFPFVLLANRDESFDRAAAPMAWWPAQPAGSGMLAGRDLSAGGTWLGLTAAGRLALVTNVREPGRVLAASPSRGDLVLQWLQAGHGVQDSAALQAMGAVPRNGFNLLVADLAGHRRAGVQGTDDRAPARWLSNRPQLQQCQLGPGVHGLSNAALDTPWPKLVRLKQRLHDMLAVAQDLPGLQAAGFAALADPQLAEDAQLPATGLPLLRERQLSPAFIRIVGDDPAVALYGTRCATLVAVQQQAGRRSVHVVERSFGPAGSVTGEARYEWDLPVT
jgi:uncharacterized protein with NRDE domain